MPRYTNVRVAQMEAAEEQSALVVQFTSAQRRSRELMCELIRAMQEQEEAARQLQAMVLSGHPSRRERTA